MIYKEQKEKKWPGLVEETENICQWLEIESVHTTLLEVQQFRKVVTEACHRANEQMLRKEAEGKEKVARLQTEAYEKKDYLSKQKIENVRRQFRARYKMLPFAGNFGKDRRFSHTEWLCLCKEEKEQESHLLAGSCKVYGDIRRRFGDLDDEEDLVEFFKEVLERREELEAGGDAAQRLEDEDTLVGGGNTTDGASSGGDLGRASLCD